MSTNFTQNWREHCTNIRLHCQCVRVCVYVCVCVCVFTYNWREHCMYVYVCLKGAVSTLIPYFYSSCLIFSLLLLLQLIVSVIVSLICSLRGSW